MDTLEAAVRIISIVFEVAGLGILIGGFTLAFFRAATHVSRGERLRAYNVVRRLFGKSILLGLEVLVAADIIRTIAIEPTLQNLYVLGLLVLIRTFLSWSLDVELEGVWPWGKRQIEDYEQRFGIQHVEESE